MLSHRSRERIRRFEESCRQRGTPLTHQRRLILETILSRDDHPTADEVYADVRVRIPNISRRTIYRIMELLVALDVVRRVCHPGATIRFDPKIDQHDHLVCLRCNKLVDIETVAAKRFLVPPEAQRLRFKITHSVVQFRGFCAECRQRREEEEQLGREGK